MNISLTTSDCVMLAKQGQRSLLTAKVTDGLGRPVAGQQVSFRVTEGSGQLKHPHPSVKIPVDITNPHGEAYMYFESDGEVGHNEISASA
jgi:hypothetical protein